MVSKEYLFRECVLHRHCILLNLYRPIIVNEKYVNEIFMNDIIMTEDEQKQLLLNIGNGINTDGVMNVVVNVDGNPNVTQSVVILTTNIESFEHR